MERSGVFENGEFEFLGEFGGGLKDRFRGIVQVEESLDELAVGGRVTWVLCDAGLECLDGFGLFSALEKSSGEKGQGSCPIGAEVYGRNEMADGLCRVFEREKCGTDSQKCAWAFGV